MASGQSDPRYGCSLCDDLPGLGFLDRLKKGVSKFHHQYSLQHHVETYHPDVEDWMSLKVDLPPVQRGGEGKRKRKKRTKKTAASATNNLSGNDADIEDEVSSIVEGNKQTLTQTQTQTQLPTQTFATHINSNTNTSSAQVSLSSLNNTASTMDLGRTREAQEQEQDHEHEPAPNTTATALATNEDRRDELIALRTQNQHLVAANSSLTRQNESLLRFLINSVGHALTGQAITTNAVWNTMMEISGGDGQLAEQVLGKVVQELHLRREAAA